MKKDSKEERKMKKESKNKVEREMKLGRKTGRCNGEKGSGVERGRNGK